MRKNDQRNMCLSISVLLLTGCPMVFSNGQGVDSFRLYAGLPVEAHLLIADIKLDDLIQLGASGGEAARERAQKLQQAKTALHEAIRKFEYFRTGDEITLSETWKFSWAPPGPGFPPLGKSPLSLLEHLWIGYDEATQTKVRIMVAAVAYSPAQVRRHQFLDDSIDLVKKAIDEIGSSGVWIVHWSSGARAMISAPPEYESISPLESEIFRLVKSKPDGSPQGLVIVSRAQLSQEDMDITPERYRERRMDKTRQKFADMSVVELGESRVDSGDFATSYAYQYTWDGDLVKTLSHIRGIGNTVFEVSYVSLAESFDRREADLIVESFHTL